MLRRQWAVLRRYPNFRRLWIGQGISAFGSAITTLALPLTAVLALGASPAQMGALAAAGFAPHLMFGLVAGIWVDRLSRRLILIVTDFGRAALLGSIPILAVLGALNMAYLYAVAFLAGVCTLFFDVAETSFVPSLVGRDDLLEANSASALGDSAALTTGPALAGVLVQLLTAPVSIALDALSYVVSALLSVRIRVVEHPTTDPGRQPRLLAEIGEGMRALAADPVVRDVIGASTVGSFGGAIQQAVLVLFLVRELGLSPAFLGIRLAAYGVTSLCGAMLAGAVRDRRGPGPAIVGGTLLWWVSSLIVALTAGPPALVIALVLLAQVLAGIGIPVYSINQVTVRQAVVPGRLLGRVNATRRFLVFGIIPIGSLLGGVLGQAVGLRQALVIGALVQGLSLLWLVASPVRGLRDVPSPPIAPEVAS